jgi:outer membrane protein with beta-barrel domain
VKRLLAAALVLAAAPARAQHTEVSVLAGYTTAGDIEMKAPQFQDLAIDDSFTVGLQVARFFNARLGVEGSWIRQHSGLSFTSRGGSGELLALHADQLQASLVYQLADDDGLQPFLFAGLGATFFSADEPESEAKLAPVLGAGLKWFGSGPVGARLLLRYNPTHLNDSASDFCDPFGFCQSWLQQFAVMGGVSLRF